MSERAFTLDPGAAHVWWAPLDLDPRSVESLELALSEDERARADGFVSDTLRRRFVAARGTLRRLLGRYLGIAAREVTFRYGPRGKPCLAAGSGKPTLEFNVSHAEGLAALAFSDGGPVGIDVECADREVDAAGLARRYFAPGEVAHLDRPPADTDRLAFLRCWTRKEAYLKATGHGLAQALNELDVTAEPGRVTLLSGGLRTDPGWRLVDLAPPGEYVAALATPAPAVRARTWIEPAQALAS